MSTDIQFQGITIKPALTWILLTAPNSPCDCYVKLAQSKHYLMVQKKGTITRKNLLQNLFKSHVYEMFVPEDHYRFYVDHTDQILNSSFANEKLNVFKQAEHLYINLVLPDKAAVPYQIQKLQTELGFKKEDFKKESLKTPAYPEDIHLFKILYEDIDLNQASLEKVVDNSDKIEIESLKRKMSESKVHIEQLEEVIKSHEEDLAKAEQEQRKHFDEISKVQGELNKVTDDFEDLKRKSNIMKSELDDLLSGQKDAKQIYAARVTSLEKRLEEIRTESQDFKLKFAREIEKNKELTKNLNQAQSNLTKTAAALKKFTTPKAS